MRQLALNWLKKIPKRKKSISDLLVMALPERVVSAGHRHFCLYGFLQHDWSRQNQNKEIWPRGTGSTQTLCTEM